MKYGSLFTGIGGIDLGLDRAGMECIWQVEIDDWCQKILNKHWPNVPKYKDVRKCRGLEHGKIWKKDYKHFGILEPVDLIAGGFPCQPHSYAGKRRGAEDDRNLWPEFSRIIRTLKPRYVLGENVSGIVTTYLDTVLSDLEGQGYTCTTFNLPACAFDAPHRRERIFIVAYSNGTWKSQSKRGKQEQRQRSINSSQNVADSGSARQSRQRTYRNASNRKTSGERETVELIYGGIETIWSIEPDVGRVAHGIPSRMDRLRGLGNAVVPQVAEWIGRRIIEFDNQGD